MLLAAVIGALCVWKVYERHQVIRLGYDLSQAREERRLLEEDRNRLRLEESVLTNPDRVERLAKALGMARPKPNQLQVVRDSQTVAVGEMQQ